MTKVELHPAVMWDCPACGVENFARIVSEYAETHVEDGETLDGFVCAPPERVTCKGCGVEYESDLPTPEGDETETPQ